MTAALQHWRRLPTLALPLLCRNGYYVQVSAEYRVLC